MNFLENIFRVGKANAQPADEQPADEQPKPPERSAAMLRAELEMSQGAVESLGVKLAAAQAELVSCQGLYDLGMRDYALGRLSSEPDRGELAAVTSKNDALHRILRDQQQLVARLTVELAQAELWEAIQSGNESLPALIEVAESRLVEFEQAAARVRQIERELFFSLFDQRAGLRQKFASTELNRAAMAARLAIVKRLEISTRKSGYWPALNPDFETDGNVNLGRVEPNWYRDYSPELSRQATLNRMSGRDVMAARLAEAERGAL